MSNDPKKAVEQVVQQGVSAQQSNKEMIKDLVEALLPAAVAAVAAGQQNANAARASAAQIPNERCPECRQLKAACKGKHVKMVVFVSGAYSRWFQGCKCNGIVYLSNHAGHALTVPADNDFGWQMEQFRASEERFATGRNFEHDSGSIGPNGNGAFVPAVGPAY